ncbi:phage tail-collar fiber domain-containing protein [Serratia rhizosphaerae]
MSQTVITYAFEQWKAQQAVNGNSLLLDGFIFANVPGLDPAAPIDRAEGIPPAGLIVHRQDVSHAGVVNENAVVYSVTLGADVGDFEFNWIGLVNKDSNLLAMVVHAPTQKKVKNAAGQQGNVLTRSFLMEYNGAETQTQITTPAETWQIDFTARLAGMDERQRLENLDIYGPAAFFGGGYLVTKAGSDYSIAAGAGYVGGLRTQLASVEKITVTTKPVKVWVDVCWKGTLTSVWEVETVLHVAASMEDYVKDGRQHYVFAVAQIDANGSITDLRPRGSLSEQASDAAFLRKDDNLAALKNKVTSRRNLGLGTAATVDIGTSNGNVMPVGAFGLGGTGIQISNADTVDRNGFYSLRAGAHRGSPGGVASWEMLCIKYDSGSAKQIFWQAGVSSTKTYIRSRTSPGGVWSDFDTYYSTRYKPTSQDIGALPLTGGTVTGLTTFTSVVDANALNVAKGLYINEDATVSRTLYVDGEDFVIKRGLHDQNGSDRQTNGYRIQGAGDLFADLYHHERVGQHHFFGIHVANGGRDGWFEFRNDGGIWANGSQIAPPGTPLPWLSDTLPQGWLLCAGQPFDRNAFPLLAWAFPGGVLPDLRGVFLRGKDNGRGIDPNRQMGSLQWGQAPASAIGGGEWGRYAGRDTGHTVGTGSDNTYTYRVLQETEQQRETRPVNVAVNYIVRAA